MDLRKDGRVRRHTPSVTFVMVDLCRLVDPSVSTLVILASADRFSPLRTLRSLLVEWSFHFYWFVRLPYFTSFSTLPWRSYGDLLSSTNPLFQSQNQTHLLSTKTVVSRFYWILWPDSSPFVPNSVPVNLTPLHRFVLFIRPRPNIQKGMTQ